MKLWFVELEAPKTFENINSKNLIRRLHLVLKSDDTRMTRLGAVMLVL